MRVLRLLGLRLARVRGHSMAPAIPDGAYVLLRSYGGKRHPRHGDICVFRTVHGQRMIKRVIQKNDGGDFAVRGDGGGSAPGTDIGPVAEQDMPGRVILTLRPHRRGPWSLAPNRVASE